MMPLSEHSEYFSTRFKFPGSWSTKNTKVVHFKINDEIFSRSSIQAFVDWVEFGTLELLDNFAARSHDLHMMLRTALYLGAHSFVEAILEVVITQTKALRLRKVENDAECKDAASSVEVVFEIAGQSEEVVTREDILDLLYPFYHLDLSPATASPALLMAVLELFIERDGQMAGMTAILEGLDLHLDLPTLLKDFVIPLWNMANP